MDPLDPQVVVAPLFCNAHLMPHMGPLNPVTSKEVVPLYWVYGSIRPAAGIDYSKS